MEEEKDKAAKKHFRQLFWNRNNSLKIFDINIECDKNYKDNPECEFGIEKLAKSKAWGLDGLPRELFKDRKMNDKIVKK